MNFNEAHLQVHIMLNTVHCKIKKKKSVTTDRKG